MAKVRERHLTTDEAEYIEHFLEYVKDIVGTTLKAPIRISYSIGDLNLHFYLDTKESEKSK